LFAKHAGAETSRISREHALLVSDSGLVTITGGKWTTYRAMAEQTVDRAETVAGLAHRPSRTSELRLHGAERAPKTPTGERLNACLPWTTEDVIRAAREEMARTVEDVLARRLRALFLDARAAVEMAPMVVKLLARELGRDAAWQQEQLRAFRELAAGYLPGGRADFGAP